MKWIKHSQDGFTLIEMMIVLMIISILLLIAVPSMLKSNKIVESKSCQATIKLVNGQVAAYNMDHDAKLANLENLKTEGYVDSISCPDGSKLVLDSDGKVVKSGKKS
ncbi:competence protein ComGC [Scopulibacillus daqui]|uniref:ComG operon protein 3 n=1 Tax=Scopulibacillus daqui TaxID=1469162 RepID=A0ABS2Q3U2_9BACL|nr:competence protein ComGC [Scopulibacillus daqui]